MTFFHLISPLRKHLISLLFNVRATDASVLRMMNFGKTPESELLPLPNVFHPLLMSRVCMQPSRLAQSLQHSWFLWEQGIKKEVRACGEWAQCEGAIHPGKTFWCATFFDETSHSHQHTPFSYTHAAKCRAGNSVRLSAAEQRATTFVMHLLLSFPAGRDEGHVAGINHPAIRPTKNCN